MARLKEFDKTEVLSKAMEVFWTYGYEKTSVRDLVKHLGIGQQSLYDTYGDKRDLFFATLKHYVDQNNIMNVLKEVESGKQAITSIFYNLIQSFSTTKHAKSCFMINTSIELASHDPEIAKFIANQNARMEEAFYHALIRAQTQGELTNPHQDLMALARSLYNALKGLTVTTKMTSDPASFNDIVKVTLSIFK